VAIPTRVTIRAAEAFITSRRFGFVFIEVLLSKWSAVPESMKKIARNCLLSLFAARKWEDTEFDGALP
jgi:hypothetical protein